MAGMNVSQVIEAFGGYEEAGLLFGVSRSLLAEWEQKGIPGKRWRQIAALAEIKSIPQITLDVLAHAEPSKAPRHEAAA